MNHRRFTSITFLLLLSPVAAIAWEPQEPAGVMPLDGAAIQAAFSGHVARGQDIRFVDEHNSDGTLSGHDSKGKAYSSGNEWWVKGDTICYVGPYFHNHRFCYNIARDRDGNYYYYDAGKTRPVAHATLEPLSK